MKEINHGVYLSSERYFSLLYQNQVEKVWCSGQNGIGGMGDTEKAD